MKKSLLTIILTSLLLHAADFSLAYGLKAAPATNGYILSSTIEGSIGTQYGAFGLGEDISNVVLANTLNSFTAVGFTTLFHYFHYGYLLDLKFLYIGLSYDLGMGSALNSSTSSNYLQMEPGADLIIPLVNRFALYIGYAYPFVFLASYPAGITQTDVAQGKITFGLRLVSRMLTDKDK